MKKSIIYFLLYSLVCLCSHAQIWPPDTFRWFYTDSLVTPELKAKAKKGDPYAMNDMAYAVFSSGRTADEMVGKSRKWWRQAAEAGAPRAMLHIAAFPNDDKERALRKEYLDKIYISSDADAICQAADFMRNPVLYFSEPERGAMIKFYLRAANLGSRLAQRVIAEDYVFGGVPPGEKVSVDSAYRYLKESGTYKASKFRSWALQLYPVNGDSTAMRKNRPDDAAKIFHYVIADHESGSGEDLLCNMLLGDLYYDILHKWDNAFVCYKAMAENTSLGDGDYVKSLRGYAYERMSRCYRFGRGVRGNQEEAERLLRIAQEMGSEKADDIIKRLNLLK